MIDLDIGQRPFLNTCMSYLAKISDYFKGAIEELRKVTWPTKTQTRNYSILVIAMVIGVAVFFGVLDYIFNIGLEAIIS